MNFIEKIIKNRVDGGVHSQFTRFGKGRYEGRACLNLHITNKIKISGSFEYANDFVELIAELGARFSGIIFSKQDLDEDFVKNGIQAEESKKKDLFVYIVEDVPSNIIKEIKDKIYYMLLDGEGEGISYKSKKKLPKPGKSGEAKIDDKFCKLEADLKYKARILQWAGLPECKKCKMNYVFEINEIILPKGEKDPEKLRLNSKRKGKIIRRGEMNKKEILQEFEFEA